MRHVRAVVGTLILLATFAGTASAAPGSGVENGKLYYLSLGDSLAASVQPTGDPANLHRTDEGYAEQLTAITRGRTPKLSLVKLGCPGETTATMITGGICTYDRGSQLAEAEQFLAAHRRFVAFVTIDIGANDFTCQEAACIPAGAASIQANLPVILARLRAAAGPDVPIAGMTLYNPLVASWLLGPEGQPFAVESAGGMAQVNGLLRAIFLGSGALVADVEGAFSSGDFATLVELPGLGLVPLAVARICVWTWACTPPPLGPDNHANVIGYGVIAGSFAEALGL
jgi:lysophospholipase L1-like esterase